MKTANFDLFSENVLTINEMFNVRGGDDEGETNNTTSTTEGDDGDIIL